MPTGIALEHEKAGIIPDTRVEAAALQAAVVPGRDALGRDRAGLRDRDAAPDGEPRRHHRERRHALPPALREAVEAADGSVRSEPEPEVLGEAGLKKATLDQVRAAMRDVVMSERGTGKKARVLGIEVAGKTGTAQVVKLGVDRERSNKGALEDARPRVVHRLRAVEEPEIAIAAIVEHAGGGGGAIAAPLVQQILDALLRAHAGADARYRRPRRRVDAD